ncbi:hypothetical protein ZWY2020_057091 [Hordeum vulgare]|nr:hypothetical protein ZWY2020_057091 [Hordeum vulgare]
MQRQVRSADPDSSRTPVVRPAHTQSPAPPVRACTAHDIPYLRGGCPRRLAHAVSQLHLRPPGAVVLLHARARTGSAFGHAARSPPQLTLPRAAAGSCPNAINRLPSPRACLSQPPPQSALTVPRPPAPSPPSPAPPPRPPAGSTAVLPLYTRNHSVPAFLFSSGGFAGNLYHDYMDVLVPLFTGVFRLNRVVASHDGSASLGKPRLLNISRTPLPRPAAPAAPAAGRPPPSPRMPATAGWPLRLAAPRPAGHLSRLRRHSGRPLPVSSARLPSWLSAAPRPAGHLGQLCFHSGWPPSRLATRSGRLASPLPHPSLAPAP